jgi:hypothetical protein
MPATRKGFYEIPEDYSVYRGCLSNSHLNDLKFSTDAFKPMNIKDDFQATLVNSSSNQYVFKDLFGGTEKDVNEADIIHVIVSGGNIPSGMFANNTKLESISLYENESNPITEIGALAFYGCSSLKSMVIPNSVETIRKKAFQNCSFKTFDIGRDDEFNLQTVEDYGLFCEVEQRSLYNGIEYNPAKGFLYYGTGYSFAGWVMRQYGIAAIREASWCKDRNWASIVTGINAVKDKEIPTQTEETILRDYAATCIKGMFPVTKQQPYVYFTSTASTDPSQEKYYCKSQNYGYPLTRIYTNSRNDISSTGFETTSPEYQRKIAGLDLSQFGCIELRGFEKYDANQIADLRPYGMMLHELGRPTGTGAVTFKFSSDSIPSPDEKMYLVVY